MGILPYGIFGGFYKKTGPAVGRLSGGKNVVTGLYHESNAPSTPKQLIEQQKFTLLNNFLCGMAILVGTGFKQFTRRRNALNEAYKFNYPHAFLSAGDQFKLDYPKMVYSRGNVLQPNGLIINQLNGNVVFSWTVSEQTMYCRSDDKATFLVYNTDKDEFIWSINAAERQALSYELDLPPEYAGDLMHCYMNFNSQNGKLAGDSLYAGPLAG